MEEFEISTTTSKKDKEKYRELEKKREELVKTAFLVDEWWKHSYFNRGHSTYITKIGNDYFEIEYGSHETPVVEETEHGYTETVYDKNLRVRKVIDKNFAIRMIEQRKKEIIDEKKSDVWRQEENKRKEIIKKLEKELEENKRKAMQGISEESRKKIEELEEQINKEICEKFNGEYDEKTRSCNLKKL